MMFDLSEQTLLEPTEELNDIIPDDPKTVLIQRDFEQACSADDWKFIFPVTPRFI